MYGHQFYQASVEKRVQFVNQELQAGRFHNLDELAQDMFLDVNDMKQELQKENYFFVPDLKQFVLLK